MLSEAPFSILDIFELVDDAIDANADIADAILATGLEAFGLPADPDGNTPTQSWQDTATTSDINKANTTIRQFYRDWSASGRREREVCYDPILKALREIFGERPEPEVRVLIPGAGLGRLVLDVCLAGFSAEGNEISYHQLLASSWMLNHTEGKEKHALYPFVSQFSNLTSRSQQLQKVMIPDVHPGSAVTAHSEAASEGRETLGTMSMSASDFLVLYGDLSNREAFHAVTTVFFIDTAPNLIRYIETIWNCLKPGGAWINVGPLLWHFEHKAPGEKGGKPEAGNGEHKNRGIGEPGSVELTEDEVLQLVGRMGFTIEKRETVGECGYIQDPGSMLQNLYRPSHWIARKNQ
jgi:carnosine N-methyltransferase